MKSLLLLLLIGSPVDGALFFSGGNAHLDNNNFPAQSVPWVPGSRVSISMWIRRTVTNYAGLDSANLHDQGGGQGNRVIAIDNTKTNRLQFSYQKSSDASEQTYVTAANALSVTNQWIHLVFVNDFSTPSATAFYLNGVAQVGSWTVGTGGTAPFQNNQPKVGTDNYSHFLAGEMTEYCIFVNQLLTYREITILGSGLKRVPMQIRANQGNGTAAGLNGAFCYFPLDFFPNGAATTFTNNVKDISSYNRPLSSIGTLSYTPERVCSYPPNE